MTVLGPNDSGDGRGSLRHLVQTIEPPNELDARVRHTLAARGLIRQPTPRFSAWVIRAGLIAAGIIFGAMLHAGWTRASGRPSTQPGQYVLLLFGETPGDTGAVHVAREREYGQWASTLANGARWVGGHELGDVVDDIGPKPTGAPAAGRLAGYFVIDASSREQAAEVARSCPHLKYGGRVVVMTITS
jgi:hypothetical protein